MGNPLIPPCDPRYLRGLKDPADEPPRKEKKLEAWIQEQYQKGNGVCRDPQTDEFKLFSVKDTQAAQSGHLVNLFGEPIQPAPSVSAVQPTIPAQQPPSSPSPFEREVKDPSNYVIVGGLLALIGTVAGLVRHYRKRAAEAVAAQPEPKPEAKPEPQPEPKSEPKPAAEPQLPEVQPPPIPQNQGFAKVLAGLMDLHRNDLMNLREYRELGKDEQMRVLRAVAEGSRIEIGGMKIDATIGGSFTVDRPENMVLRIPVDRNLPAPNVSLARQEYERAVVQLRNMGAKDPEAWAQELTLRRSLYSTEEWQKELAHLNYEPLKPLPPGESPLPLEWVKSFDVVNKEPAGGAISDVLRTRVMAAVKLSPPPLPVVEPVDDSFEGRKTVVLQKSPVAAPVAAPKPGFFGSFFGGIADGFRAVGRFFARLNPFASKPKAPKAEAQPKPEANSQTEPQPLPQPAVIDPEVQVLMENIRAVEPAAFEGVPETDLQLMAEQVREMRINGVFEGMVENGIIKPEGLRLALRMAKIQASARGAAPGSEAERRDKEAREAKGPMDHLKGGRGK